MINIQKLKQTLSYEQEISRLISAQICSLRGGALNRPLRILDVGCGTTSMLSYFNTVEYRKSCYLIGLDVHPPTIEWCRSHGFHDEYVLSDADNNVIPDVDIIIATDLIEHFEKESAIKLMATFESKASLGVFLTTPNGYIYNPYTDDNLFMQHKCGFSVEDFKQLGYECLGLGGPKWLRGDHALPRKPKIITLPMLMILSRLMRIFPKQSFHIFAKKILSNTKSE